MLMRHRGTGTAVTAIAVTLAIALPACGGDDETEEPTPTTADTAATGASGATGQAGGGGTLTEQQFREFAEGYSYDDCENPSFKDGSRGGLGSTPEGHGPYYECGPLGGAHFFEYKDETEAETSAQEESATRPQLLVGNVVVEAREPYVDNPEEFVTALSEECGCGEVIG